MSERSRTDVTSIAAVIEEAVGHLGDLDKLRTKLGVSRNGLRDAEALISDMEAKLSRCLGRAAALLSEND